MGGRRETSCAAGGPRGLSRRAFLRGAVAAGGALAAGPFEALARSSRADPASAAGYGPLAPVRDRSTGLPLLELPEGFAYATFGWTGDPLRDGTPTPPRHDGDGGLPRCEGGLVLVRNHEVGTDGGASAPGPKAYDPAAGGGTTSLLFDPKKGEPGPAWASLTGTLTNCAGGATPWGTWLSCEENVRGPDDDLPRLTKPHGYVFEVAPSDEPADPKPSRQWAASSTRPWPSTRPRASLT